MGCSYDPVPHDYYPSPAEVWMKDNKFGAITVDMYHHVSSFCQECGTLIVGHKHGPRFLALHCPVCPVTPREVVPEKTEEQCKAYKEVVWS